MEYEAEHQKIIDLLSDATIFRQWLESLDPKQEIGIPIACASCPVAVFLKCHGVVDVKVFRDEIRVRDHFYGPINPLSVLEFDPIPELQWLTPFIDKSDEMGCTFGLSKRIINASDALHVLKKNND